MTEGPEQVAADLKGQYKWEEKLELFPPMSSWEKNVNQSSGKFTAIYPSLNEFISLVLISYECSKDSSNSHSRSRELSSHLKERGNQGKVSANGRSKLGEVPHGFEILAEAIKESTGNDYYGAAYIQRDKKQIILCHTGTVFSNSKAHSAGLESICLNSTTPQVSSAMTFAHMVSLFAMETGCELFFTGNSLGGCLARITCFSVKFLTVNDVNGKFEMKPYDQWDDQHPYTVVFDSQGAFPLLQKMKDDLFLCNEPKLHEVSVSCLPIEDHQFYLSTENSPNIEIGLGRGRLFRIPFEDSNFQSCFLTSKGLELLKEMKYKAEIEGSYEGLSLKEENAANNLVEFLKGSQFLENRTIQFKDIVKRRELIPLVRDVTYKLKAGKIWWNPRKKVRLPRNFIRRRFCRSSDLKMSQPLTLKMPYTSTQETKTLLKINEDFVLLVGSSGTGRSTAISHLEQKLRKQITCKRIIIRINLNDVQKELSTISSASAFSALVQLDPFLPLKTLQMEGILVVVLLDGLQKICPRNQATTINLLRVLVLEAPSLPVNSQLRVVLTTRPEMRDPIESEFKVKSWSLAPLSFEDQICFIQEELGVTEEESEDFRAFFGISKLLSNPVLLSMLLHFVKSGGNISKIDQYNVYKFYTSFFEAKHKPPLVEAERIQAHIKKQIQSAQEQLCRNLLCSAIETRPFVKLRQGPELKRNLPFYFHIACNQLLRRNCAEDSLEDFIPDVFLESIGNVALEPLPGSTKKELLNFGFVVENSAGKLQFKRRVFAELIYTKLLTLLETPQSVKDTLFGYIYRSPHEFENVEEFILANENTPLVSITSKWLFVPGNVNQSCSLFVNFVEGKLFRKLDHDILRSFVIGDEPDLFEAFCVLVNLNCKDAFFKFFGSVFGKPKAFESKCLLGISAIDHNTQNRYSPAVARILVAFAIAFEDQQFLSEREVKLAFTSCDRLISTVAVIQVHNRNKWDFVEQVLGIEWMKLLETADHVDYMRIIDDVEIVEKLYAKFSLEELFSLVSEELS